MHIVHLTAGTGSFFCGTCLRDHALVSGLRRLAHDAVMVPMYLPLVLDAADSAVDAPLFFGGINVYLQQKSAVFRHTPEWLDKLLDAPVLLDAAAQKAGMTSPRELGEMTLSMLEGEHGHQAKELRKLITWLREQKPEVVCLSNSLLIGVAREIRAKLQVPIVCSLQGEDAFIDALPEPYREKCWRLLQERAADVARFVAPSRYYRELMQERLQLSAEKIAVIHNGIELDGFGPAASLPPQPTVGYLARMCRDKGLALVVEAFAELKAKVPEARLKIAGSQTDADKPFVQEQTAVLSRAGILDAVEFLPNLTQSEKQHFLQTLSVLSVPTRYGEAFGLFVLEALAAGVPVVQPDSGAFPELIELTGGGVLFRAGDSTSLANAWEELLRDPQMAAGLGRRGREEVNARFTSEAMARKFDALLREL